MIIKALLTYEGSSVADTRGAQLIAKHLMNLKATERMIETDCPENVLKLNNGAYESAHNQE